MCKSETWHTENVKILQKKEGAREGGKAGSMTRKKERKEERRHGGGKNWYTLVVRLITDHKIKGQVIGL